MRSCILAVLAALAVIAPSNAATCESLSSLKLPDTTITLAEPVAPGAFARPSGTFVERGPGAPPVFKSLPAFCRVAATLKPTSDSDIKIEVWLPASGWNGKFEAVGNGGWAGVISYESLAEAVRDGYATASTDTGHAGGRGTFALDHPEKLVDFGYRAVHQMTVQAKAITESFYGRAPRMSYWNGCSTGGRQGLKEAQRFPNDYDGIIAGASANPRTSLSSWQIWLSQVVLDPANYIPASKYPVIHQAVLEACDATDGLKDGLITDPTRCHFDPEAIECKGADAPTCLTAGQVAAAERMYTVPKTSSGEQVYYNLEPGSELGWGMLARGPEPFTAATDQFRYVVYKNPNWDWHTFNLDRDHPLADKIDHDTINAADPNLTAFLAHGGKLLMYHGWADPGVPPLASVNYYKAAVDTMGGERKTADSIRLFMVPGMGHCGGGEGPNTFDMMTAMVAWREDGKTPERIVASRMAAGKVERTRPLCAYPQVAQYNGSGSIDDAKNFVCEAPK
ncbi:MAG TPA: tannase/feruloyl esterase family alpha/beta hydrolase [Bryobacteraceae bacterium]|nr:tannase/feruloyl esterase family alpha/beta hydrolase [Bryobacteraceae bacterium]